MMLRQNSLFCFLGLVLFAAPLVADQRILFRFDNAGVQIDRVVRLDEVTDFSSSLDAAAQPGNWEIMIEISWLGTDGSVLAKTYVADPRVAQSPNHTNAYAVSRLGLTEGGWVASGPDGAESVIVVLPGKPALGLAAETWTLSLYGKI